MIYGDHKFNVGEHARISQYRNIFAKGYVPDWTVLQKKMQKANQTGIRIRKVIKRKGDKTYVKWKGYNNSSNSWID